MYQEILLPPKDGDEKLVMPDVMHEHEAQYDEDAVKM